MRRQSHQSKSRPQSHQRKSAVPQSLDLISDESKKQHKTLKGQNSRRWNESSEQERKNRLKACLHNVAQIDCNRQHNIPPNYRASFTKANSLGAIQQRGRASRRRTETDISIQQRMQYAEERTQNVKKAKKNERESIRKSISEKGSFWKENEGWFEPIVEEKPTVSKLSSFIEENFVGSKKQSSKQCDNGAFSLWPIAKALPISRAA